ncbi:hypothetical protein CYMTET_26450 [Cymbomonas tetramitiformis]|uniref:Uncharacterized protein n=1 Tax=Cymbomonas tetramitiformis TaxID=36881 RepID=A0AAE0KY16_9CHLO|nr:hypothetical protein CYMTET_26450 [Cymbomonas tetramitiformis]
MLWDGAAHAGRKLTWALRLQADAAREELGDKISVLREEMLAGKASPGKRPKAAAERPMSSRPQQPAPASTEAEEGDDDPSGVSRYGSMEVLSISHPHGAALAEVVKGANASGLDPRRPLDSAGAASKASAKSAWGSGKEPSPPADKVADEAAPACSPRPPLEPVPPAVSVEKPPPRRRRHQDAAAEQEADDAINSLLGSSTTSRAPPPPPPQAERKVAEDAAGARVSASQREQAPGTRVGEADARGTVTSSGNDGGDYSAFLTASPPLPTTTRGSVPEECDTRASTTTSAADPGQASQANALDIGGDAVGPSPNDSAPRGAPVACATKKEVDESRAKIRRELQAVMEDAKARGDMQAYKQALSVMNQMMGGVSETEANSFGQQGQHEEEEVLQGDSGRVNVPGAGAGSTRGDPGGGGGQAEVPDGAKAAFLLEMRQTAEAAAQSAARAQSKRFLDASQARRPPRRPPRRPLLAHASIEQEARLSTLMRSDQVVHEETEEVARLRAEAARLQLECEDRRQELERLEVADRAAGYEFEFVDGKYIQRPPKHGKMAGHKGQSDVAGGYAKHLMSGDHAKVQMQAKLKEREKQEQAAILEEKRQQDARRERELQEVKRHIFRDLHGLVVAAARHGGDMHTYRKAVASADALLGGPAGTRPLHSRTMRGQCRRKEALQNRAQREMSRNAGLLACARAAAGAQHPLKPASALHLRPMPPGAADRLDVEVSPSGKACPLWRQLARLAQHLGATWKPEAGRIWNCDHPMLATAGVRNKGPLQLVLLEDSDSCASVDGAVLATLHAAATARASAPARSTDQYFIVAPFIRPELRGKLCGQRALHVFVYVLEAGALVEYTSLNGVVRRNVLARAAGSEAPRTTLQREADVGEGSGSMEEMMSQMKGELAAMASAAARFGSPAKSEEAHFMLNKLAGHTDYQASKAALREELLEVVAKQARGNSAISSDAIRVLNSMLADVSRPATRAGPPGHSAMNFPQQEAEHSAEDALRLEKAKLRAELEQMAAAAATYSNGGHVDEAMSVLNNLLGEEASGRSSAPSPGDSIWS